MAKRTSLTVLFKDFFESEKAGGLVLVGCTIISLCIANSGFGERYHHFWQMPIGDHTIGGWINDGLMTVFFLMIGLELERELYKGELSNIREALLPVFAATGGMIVPAGIFFLFNFGTTAQAGAGIPMATDIAFALGALSLLGKRVPASMKVFLAALAVIDDLGAILVIALFYTSTLHWSNLFISLGIFVLLLTLNRMKVRNLVPYLAGGIAMWYFMLHSGVHATITGVLLAFAIPFGNGDERSTSYLLQKFLHKPVAFIILPVFALANTAIPFSAEFKEVIASGYSMGVALGLIIGKPLGIFLFSFIAVWVGISKLPAGLKWRSVIGVGFLGGIGFTMSIFITMLAFNDEAIVNNIKLVILLASLVAGIIGVVILKAFLKPVADNAE
jgi:NhaA family Na+:H+ antiporter